MSDNKALALVLAEDIPVLFANGEFDSEDIEEICTELRRLAAVEAELERIRALEPVAYLIRKADNPESKGWPIPANQVGSYQRDSLTRTPLYDLTPKDPT